MQHSQTPASKRLVLLGGGHSHLAVLMFLARNPLPGLDITLLSKDIETPYSGALPAFIAGSASQDDLFIDLRPLAQMAGVRLIQTHANAIDLDTKAIHCPDRPAVLFDYLSINIGSRPNTSLIPGADEFALAVKPIPFFLEQWQAVQEQAKKNQHIRLAIIGGGPASIEMACAMTQSLRQPTQIQAHLHIITRASSVLPGHGKKAQTLATQTLAQKGITVHTHCHVSHISKTHVHFHKTNNVNAAESNLEIDYSIVATGASPARWLEQTGLALDEQGFIRVNDHLQSLSHPFVFAAGDVAAIAGQQRPKSGVFAVRQGPPLASNLRQFALGAKLKSYQAQQHALALLSVGEGVAIASRGRFAVRGRWVERWKTWIDRRFVDKYSQLPAMKEARTAKLDTQSALSTSPHPPIRCAGCAAKLSSASLTRVISAVHTCGSADVLSTLHSTEDASIIHIEAQRVLLQSVDYLRSFINDPYLFARIASNHCLSDIHAMGASAHSALAIVGIPHAAAVIMEDQLAQVMQGSTEVLNAHGTTLLGGHTSEAETLSFGLSVNAFADPAKLLRKTGMQPGDVLILSKGLGTGTLLAADMRHRAKHRWIKGALEQMQRSNQSAAEAFVAHNATACTDITGFGLLGHLREMLASEPYTLKLQLSAVPFLEGSLWCIDNGLLSSLHHDNALHANLISNAAQFPADPRVELLFDPQTAGGLLATVPREQAQACLAQLHRCGDLMAACIGSVLSRDDSRASIELYE